jgi:hypothetical protein
MKTDRSSVIVEFVKLRQEIKHVLGRGN